MAAEQQSDPDEIEAHIRRDVARWNIEEDHPDVPPDFVARVAQIIRQRRPSTARTEREQRTFWMGQYHVPGYRLLMDEDWEREAELVEVADERTS